MGGDNGVGGGEGGRVFRNNQRTHGQNQGVVESGDGGGDGWGGGKGGKKGQKTVLEQE